MAPWQLSLASLAWILVLATVAVLTTILVLFRAIAVSQNIDVPKCRPKRTPVHLFVVLGSGGHTAEMFSMLRRMKLDPSVYSYRTYAVSSGDNFSAAKAAEFETSLRSRETDRQTLAKDAHTQESYSIVTVPRARRVHQSYLTAPFSTIQCFWACLLALRGLHSDQGPLPSNILSPYPDLILTNGPATAVCVVLAAKVLRLCRYLNPLKNDTTKSGKGNVKPKTEEEEAPLDYQLRAIFVESWARVTTLSLSGKLLLPFVDRFLVQWPALEGKAAWKGMRKTEYVGALVD